MPWYWVVTPVYTTYGPGQYDPPEYGCDAIEIYAPNKRAAKVEAVRKMSGWEKGHWVKDQRADEHSPFTGLRVQLWDEDEDGPLPH